MTLQRQEVKIGIGSENGIELNEMGMEWSQNWSRHYSSF
jgi:hypothetical protein